MARRRHSNLVRFGGVLFISSSAALGIFALLLMLNIWTYQRLSSEVDVAVLSFEQIGDRLFDATLALPDGSRSNHRLRGDDWQLEVRMIKWQPWFSLLGKDPLFRLDRLRGRFDDVELERSESPTVHQLSENPGIDLWSLLRKHASWLPAVDAVYGSASYLPMTDGASYRITLGQSGLVARSVARAQDGF